jgi:hypothetical protein
LSSPQADRLVYLLLSLIGVGGATAAKKEIRMKPSPTTGIFPILRALTLIAGVALAPAAFGQQVTFSPYLQLGDNGAFGPTDLIVIAWQTDEASPKASAYKVEFQAPERDHRTVTPQARVLDNYLGHPRCLWSALELRSCSQRP